jgi:hypothetical protein
MRAMKRFCDQLTLRAGRRIATRMPDVIGCPLAACFALLRVSYRELLQPCHCDFSTRA